MHEREIEVGRELHILIDICFDVHSNLFILTPDSVAQSDAWSTGDQEVASLRLRSGPILVEIDHEIFSTVILSLLLIQEGKLSVTCERMCTEYWLNA